MKDSEVPVEKYVSEEERKRLEEEKQRSEKKGRKEDEEAVERALNAMMGGTLEDAKEQNILDEELERPEWMNKPIEEMTDEEVEAKKNSSLALRCFGLVVLLFFSLSSIYS